jgi:predicted CoA-binding protein
MNKKEIIGEFLNGEPIAVVGVSSNEKKFGSTVFKDLLKKGYTVYPVNPKLAEFNRNKCYPDLTSLKGKVKRALLVVPSLQTSLVVHQAFESGIELIWMQQGSESESASEFCRKNGIKLIDHECILMFAQPVVSFHKFHRFVAKLFRKLPA